METVPEARGEVGGLRRISPSWGLASQGPGSGEGKPRTRIEGAGGAPRGMSEKTGLSTAAGASAPEGAEAAGGFAICGELAQEARTKVAQNKRPKAIQLPPF